MAFGGEAVDHYGVTRRFPTASMITGLLANALGWRRTESDAHQQLQDRLVFAARIDREPASGWRMRDFQTAQLKFNDTGWTTRGTPEGRKGGRNTYRSPHIRYRDYLVDMVVTVVLGLEPPQDTPDLDRLAAALQQPARPLFIGRKPCLPSAPLFERFVEDRTPIDALLNLPLSDTRGSGQPQTVRRDVRLLWSADDHPQRIRSIRTYHVTDQRNWNSSSLHGGSRSVCEATVPHTEFPGPGPDTASANAP